MPLKFAVKLGYGIGHTTNDLCSAIWFTYLLIFYELVLEFTTFYSGIFMLIGQIADAFATPIIGILCDRGPTFWKLNLRRRKGWYATGSVVVLLTFPFLYSKCVGCENSGTIVRIIYYSIIIIIFQIAWASVQIAHLAIAADLTPLEKERTTLMALRSSCTVFSGLLVYLSTFLIFHLTTTGESSKKLEPSDITKFQYVVFTSLGIGTVATIIFYFNVKENEKRLRSSYERMMKRKSYKELFCRFSLYQVALAYMSTRLICNVPQAMLPLYLNVTLLLEKSTIASLPFVMYISSFIASLLSDLLNRLIGRKLTFTLGSFLTIAAAVWLGIDTSHLYKKYFIYIIVTLLGFASSTLLVTSLAAAAEHIGDDIDNSAFVYGILSFIDKLSCGIVIMLIQTMEKKGGPMYYKNVLSYVCIGASTIGLICVITLKKPAQIDTEETQLPGAVREPVLPSKRKHRKSVLNRFNRTSFVLGIDSQLQMHMFQ